MNARGVEYLVIGGHAVAFYGYPRATADLDVWIAVNPANASRVVAALKEFGFDVPELLPDLFLREDRVIRMGVAPNRIEIQTGIDGVTFAECYARRIKAELDGIVVWFISLSDLKANKRAAGRNKDMADLDSLFSRSQVLAAVCLSMGVDPLPSCHALREENAPSQARLRGAERI